MLLLFWFLWDCIVDTKIHPSDNNFWLDGVVPVYRASGMLILAYWMWGLNVWLWRKFRINYLFLLELHPRTSDTHRKIFSNAISLSLLYLCSFLLYFKMERGDFPQWFPAGINPSLMFLLLMVIMIPWPGCGTPVKQWPIAFCQVLLAPFFPVKFLHVFIGDVLTSFVKPGIDIAYAFCFIGSGLFLKTELGDDNGRICLDSPVLEQIINPIVSALPLWLRLLQCLRRYHDTHERFPHMVNAGKYATAASVVIVGVFHQNLSHGAPAERSIWILSLAASTMYSYTWDVFVDWDLGKKHSHRLRPDLMYKWRPFYYSAIVLDLVFRFIWSLTFVPASTENPLGSWYVHSLIPVISACEIIRRGVWALIRVENEHLNVITNYKPPEAPPMGEEARSGDGIDDHYSSLFASAEEADQQDADDDRGPTKGFTLILEIAALIIIVGSVALVSYFTH